MILFEFLLCFCNNLFSLSNSRRNSLSLFLKISINSRFHIVSFGARGGSDCLSLFTLINEASLLWRIFFSGLASLCWNIQILTLKLFFRFICESVIVIPPVRSAVHLLNMLLRWLLCYLPFHGLHAWREHHLLNRIILAIFRFLRSGSVVLKLYLLLLTRMVTLMKESLFL